MRGCRGALKPHLLLSKHSDKVGIQAGHGGILHFGILKAGNSFFPGDITLHGCTSVLHIPRLHYFACFLFVRRFPWLLRTHIPAMLRYPTRPGAFAFQTALVRIFYAPDLGAKVDGLWALLSTLWAARQAGKWTKDD